MGINVEMGINEKWELMKNGKKWEMGINEKWELMRNGN